MNLKGFITLFTLLIHVGICNADEFSPRLLLADSLRSSDIEEFSRTLDEIRFEKERLNKHDLDLYMYLEAYRLSYSGKIFRALQEYEMLLMRAKSNEIKLRAAASILNTYAISRDFGNGYRYIPKINELIEKSKSESKNNAMNTLGVFYNQTGDYEAAERSAHNVISNNPSKRNLCLAKHIEFESKFKRNIEVFDNEIYSAIEICEKENEFVISGMILTQHANTFLNKENHKEALNILRDRAHIIESTKYPRLLAEYYSTLSSAYLKNDELSTSEHFSIKSLEHSKNMGFTTPFVKAYYNLSLIYERKGDLSKSLTYYKKYAEADKAYLDEVKVKQLAIQQAKHDAIEKANQIALLDKENTLLKTQARLTKEEQENNRLFMAFLMLVILMVVLWAYKNRRMHLKIRQQAETDDLTGISNRGHFSQVAESALNYHQKTRQPLAFVIFDLDLFKKVNDQFGHQVGDWALKAAVDALKRVCREQDQIGRMGGEEFAILLPGCSIGKAMQVAEACRQAIETIDTSPSGEHFTLTASFGVADTQVCGYEFDQLYGCADHALYQSKENGRNRVYRYIQDTSANPLSTQQTQ
jgi:diguanylate cyclase